MKFHGFSIFALSIAMVGCMTVDEITEIANMATDEASQNILSEVGPNIEAARQRAEDAQDGVSRIEEAVNKNSQAIADIQNSLNETQKSVDSLVAIMDNLRELANAPPPPKDLEPPRLSIYVNGRQFPATSDLSFQRIVSMPGAFSITALSNEPVRWRCGIYAASNQFTASFFADRARAKLNSADQALARGDQEQASLLSNQALDISAEALMRASLAGEKVYDCDDADQFSNQFRHMWQGDPEIARQLLTGGYRAEIVAVDKNGNSSAIARTFILADIVPPVISLRVNGIHISAREYPAALDYSPNVLRQFTIMADSNEPVTWRCEIFAESDLDDVANLLSRADRYRSAVEQAIQNGQNEEALQYASIIDTIARQAVYAIEQYGNPVGGCSVPSELTDSIATIWDGAAAGLPDGKYRARLVATNGDGASTAITGLFALDATPPRITVPVVSTIDSVSIEDAQYMRYRIDQRQMPLVDPDAIQGIGEIVRCADQQCSQTGAVVFRQIWDASNPFDNQLIWSGECNTERCAAGKKVADGNYLYRLSAVDRAGNTSVETATADAGGPIARLTWSPEVFIVEAPPVDDSSVDKSPIKVPGVDESMGQFDAPIVGNPYFSPNDDGVNDRVSASHPSFSPSDHVERWLGEVFRCLNDQCEESREIIGGVLWQADEGLPELFVWDGRDPNGNVVPDGLYRYRLTAINQYGNSSAQVADFPFVVDTVPPPLPAPSVANRFFSPNLPQGDGVLDDLVISYGSSITEEGVEWRGDVVFCEDDSCDASDPVVYTEIWSNTLPAEWRWNGRNAAGNSPEGYYYYRLTATDRADNFAAAVSTNAIVLDITPPSDVLVSASDITQSLADQSFAIQIGNAPSDIFIPNGDPIPEIDLGNIGAEKGFRLPDTALAASDSLSGIDPATWRVEVFDTNTANGDAPLATASCAANENSEECITTWQNLDRLVQANSQLSETYPMTVYVSDQAGNRSSVESSLRIIKLVCSQNVDSVIDVCRISLNTLAAEPNRVELISENANIEGYDGESILQDIIDRVGKLSNAYSNLSSILVVGHANALLDTEEEQLDALLPLSLCRAVGVADVLASTLRDQSQSVEIVSVGRGGDTPLVDAFDSSINWQNRRIEIFFLFGVPYPEALRAFVENSPSSVPLSRQAILEIPSFASRLDGLCENLRNTAIQDDTIWGGMRDDYLDEVERIYGALLDL